jgi:hypothetical protein
MASTSYQNWLPFPYFTRYREKIIAAVNYDVVNKCSPPELAVYAASQPQSYTHEDESEYGRPERQLAVRPTTPSTSSVGAFNVLPLELLHSILAKSDFRSLVRFSRTNWRANNLVVELREYQQLTTHYPEILVAMQGDGTLEWHSIGTLYSAFRSADCVACGAWAPLLHVPTCQRYCYQCRYQGQVWSLPMELFEPFEDIKIWLEAQKMLRGRNILFDGRIQLYLDRDQMMALAGQIDSSTEVAVAVANYTADGDDWHDREPPDIAAWLYLKDSHSPMLENFQELAEDADASTAILMWIHAHYQAGRVLFRRLPHLDSAGRLEHGVFCCVCRAAAVLVHDCRHANHFVSWSFPRDHTKLCFAANRARTRADFVDHIKQCPGIQILMDRRSDKNR